MPRLEYVVVIRNRGTKGLGAIEIVSACLHVPGEQFVLGHSSQGVRVAIAHAVQGGLDGFVWDAQEQRAAVPRFEWARRDEKSVGLELLQVRAVGRVMRQHLVDGASIADNRQSIHGLYYAGSGGLRPEARARNPSSPRAAYNRGAEETHVGVRGTRCEIFAGSGSG